MHTYSLTDWLTSVCSIERVPMFSLTALTNPLSWNDHSSVSFWVCAGFCVKTHACMLFLLITHYGWVKYALANGTSFGFKRCFAEHVCVFLWLHVCAYPPEGWIGGGERCSGRQTPTAALSNYWQVQCVLLWGLFQHDFIQRGKKTLSFTH